MGGSGSGRKKSFKTNLVLFALDIQVALTEILSGIKHENYSFDDVEKKLLDLVKQARRVCEENERL